jgi:hypothetical protein
MIPAGTLAVAVGIMHHERMRRSAAVSSISWIPSEAVSGITKLPFGAGLMHYDVPPPDAIGGPGASLEELRESDRFRFCNHLAAWIDVDDDGSIVDAGYSGGGLTGSTTLNIGRNVTVAAVALPDKQAEPERGGDWVRFVQTAGGRTGLPMPRPVRRAPFVQYHPPIAWSTLSLTIHADGRAAGELVGASSFPRHWVYGTDGALVAKTGLIDYRQWHQDAFGGHTPWGDVDSPALVTAVETALERELSGLLMANAAPVIRRVEAGTVIVAQGDVGADLFLLLDGVLAVDVDGTELGQLGPGTVLGERSSLEGGRRTSTLRAVTPCKVVVAAADTIDRALLERLSSGHRREEVGDG